MKRDRFSLEERETETLAPWASLSSRSRGRVYPEEPHPYRSEFQRDRERIIHSRAFRRLEYKTQVFLNHEGDHYRTRLTHTIEVAQISRTIARALKLNEDLAESIALAHDLGHTPFGHAGERELNNLLTHRNGFEHNRQSLRVIDVLERNYHGFPGINLTWETREGIIKHSSQYDNPDYTDFEPALRPSLEAQIIDIADEIAYNNHDLDDGLSSGLIRYPQIRDLSLWKMASEPEPLSEPGTKLFIREIIRKIINLLVTDLIETSLGSIRESGIRSYEDVRNNPHNLVSFSEAVKEANSELKTFLRGNLYNHYRVTRMTLKARRVINDLFRIYTENPAVLPEDYQDRADETDLLQTVTDYIAGMTDRFALEEHRKLTDPQARV